MKAIEALAWGRALVSTTKGVEGLGLVHGREVLIADEAADFAAAVTLAYLDDQINEQLGTAGRKRGASWAWSRLTPAFARAVREL